jgi:hypothetical protein
MLATLGFPVTVANQIPQRSLISVRLNDDIAPITTIAAIRATTRYKGFTPEAAAPVAAIAGSTKQNRSICKHEIPELPTERLSLGLK